MAATRDSIADIWGPRTPHGADYATVRIDKVEAPTTAQPERGKPSPERERGAGLLGAVAAAARGAAHAVGQAAQAVAGSAPRGHIADYIGLLHLSEERLTKAFDQVKATHPRTPDIGPACTLFAGWSRDAADRPHPFIRKYGERREGEPERLDRALLVRRSETGFDLLRDLQDLWLLVNESLVSVTVLEQAARALRDEELLGALRRIQEQNERQRTFLMTRIKQASPQTLVVPS